MFNKIKEYFEGEASLQVDKSGKVTDEDMQIATGLLLLEMAGKDEDFAPEEVQAIFRAMESEFDLKDTEVMALLEDAEQIRKEKGKIDEIVTSINNNFDTKQKQIVLSMIWRVVMADGNIDKFESRFATQMRFRLQLTEEEAKEAREMFR